MKIISKYKDYYDYLSYTIGQDPKLILDRRNFHSQHNRFIGSKYSKFTLYITGYYVEGLYYDGNFYYGENLYNICGKPTKLYSEGKLKSYYNFKKSVNILGEIVKDDHNVNNIHNCPILIRSARGSMTNNIYVERYPVLKDLNLNSFIKPEEIFQWLIDWLSTKETEKERDRDHNLTDKDKILNKGFNIKTSFRPKIKNHN